VGHVSEDQTGMTDTSETHGRARRIWRALTSRPARWSFASIFAAGGLAGVILWGGFNTAMEATNQLGFCISCHEMAGQPYEEYKQSVHYSNPSGVRVICPDCHVPKDWTAKLLRKIRASNELWHHFAGTVDTPEKFEAKRAVLAQSVWESMKSRNSQECRNCHSFAAMNFHKQSQRAREKMEEAEKRGETCIDCHKGIAHKLPVVPHDD
jgi:nitrate/TMAO reductase-like tetraheme cytochrome c subunit